MSGDLFSCFEEPVAAPARRFGLLVLGPNASGKTSAVKQAMAEFVGDSRALVVLADKSPYGHISAGEGAALLRRIWEGQEAVVVVEGTRCGTMMARAIAASPEARETSLLLTAVTPEIMRTHIEARCAKVGKLFRADYWAGKRLEAHARRHRGEALRYFAGMSTEVFEIGPAYEGHEALVHAIRDRVRAWLQIS